MHSSWITHSYHICMLIVLVHTGPIQQHNQDDDKSRSLYQFLDEPDTSAEKDAFVANGNVRRTDPYHGESGTSLSGAISYWPGFGPKSPPAIDSVPAHTLFRSSSSSFSSNSPYPTRHSPPSNPYAQPSQQYYGGYSQQQQHYPQYGGPAPGGSPMPAPYSPVNRGSTPGQSMYPTAGYPGLPPPNAAPGGGPGVASMAGYAGLPPPNAPPGGGPGVPSMPGYSPDAANVPRYPWESVGPPAQAPGRPYPGTPASPSYGPPSNAFGGAPHGAPPGQMPQPGSNPYASSPTGYPYAQHSPGQAPGPVPGPYNQAPPYPSAQSAPPRPPPPPVPQPGPGAPSPWGGHDSNPFSQLAASNFGGSGSSGPPTGQASMYGNVNPLNSAPFSSAGPPGGGMGPPNFGPQLRFSLAANKATYLTAPMLSPRGPPGPLLSLPEKLGGMGGPAPNGPPPQGSLPPPPGHPVQSVNPSPMYSAEDYMQMQAPPQMPQMPRPGPPGPQPHPAPSGFPRPGAMAWPTSAFGAVGGVGGPAPQSGSFALASRSPTQQSIDSSYESSMDMNPPPIPSLPIDIGGGGIDFGNAIGPAYPATLSMQPPISRLDMNAAGMYGALVLDMDAVVDQDETQDNRQTPMYAAGLTAMPVGSSAYDYQQVQPADEPHNGGSSTVMDALLQQVQRLRAVSYSRSDCEQCQAAEALLESAYGIPVTVFHMDKLAKGSEFLQFLGSITGSEQVPQIFICGYYIGGYEHVMKYHSSNKLGDFVKKCFDSSARQSDALISSVSTAKKEKKDEKDK